jgi:hypothetical protein
LGRKSELSAGQGDTCLRQVRRLLAKKDIRSRTGIVEIKLDAEFLDRQFGPFDCFECLIGNVVRGPAG